jgi:predicted component of type VI protein secretion system
MRRLLVTSDGLTEREWLLVSNVVVGRDPMCDISEPDSLLSRRHAEFVVSSESVLVRDLGSRNGIFINGVKVAESRIQPGDAVQIGNLIMRYVDDAVPLAAAPQIVDADRTVLVDAPSRAAHVPSGAGEPEQHDDEATRVVLPPTPRPPVLKPPTAPPATARPATARPVIARPATARPATERPATVHPIEVEQDGDATRLVSSPSLASRAMPAPPPARVEQPLAQPAASSISGFVYGIVIAQTLLTVAVTAAPFSSQIDASKVGFSIVVAAGAALITATLISRRAWGSR